jgi:hypothetical protein
VKLIRFLCLLAAAAAALIAGAAAAQTGPGDTPPLLEPAATVGPAPLAEVVQYLATLERLGVIERSRR